MLLNDFGTTVYLVVIVPALALTLGACAVITTQRSAERVREIERQR